MYQQFNTIPALYGEIVKKSGNLNGSYGSINAGILGGNDIKFLNNYATTVLECSKKYSNELASTGANIGLFNIVLEQLSFGFLSNDKNIDFLITDNLRFDEIINKLINIYTAPIDTKFVHCLGEVKKYLPIAKQIEMRLRFEYPIYYDRIIKFCTEKGYQIFTDEDYSKNEQTYKTICQYKSMSQFLESAYFQRKRNVNIIEDGGMLYLQCGTSKKEIAGWGKVLLLMDSYVNGEAISQLLYQQLKETFSLDFIRENVMSYLIQCLYNGELIELKA